MPAPTASQRMQLASLDRDLAGAEQRLRDAEPKIARAQRAWEQSLDPASAHDWAPGRRLAVALPLDGTLHGEIRRDPPRSEKYLYTMENGPAVEQAPAPAKLQPAWKEGNPAFDTGRAGPAAAFDGKRYIEVGNVANFGFYDAFSVAAWIRPAADSGAIICRAKDEPEGQGWGLSLKNGRLQANLVQRWLDDGARVETEASIPLYRWSHVILTYDGSRLAAGIRIYINGEPAKLVTHLDDLNQSFAAKEPLRIGAGLGPATRFRGLLEQVRVYRAALSPEEAAVLAVPEGIATIARLAPAGRTPAQAAKLRWCFLDTYAAPELRRLRQDVLDRREARARFVESLPTVMVMQEMPVPRETHLLIRGAYDHPGPKVSPGLPAVLPPLPAGAPNNRLGFAQWVVDPANPLTARVAVNRFWQLYFGTGLVKTVENFGSQGELPSHPELLDWLATEFIRTGWDVKALQKTIVMSATYRQSSRVTPELLQKDPENRLLARGPRVRLPAEMVRDQALAVAGLLVEKIGGPSVKPYQPAGLWTELTGGEDYHPDKGEGLHRRSLYTYWKRTAPPPMMINFDAAGRETCVVREIRTDTPLQSLNLMNDVTFLEAARALGQRMVREGGPEAEQRLAYGFRLATGRPPKARERDVLLSSLRYYRDLFHSRPDQAQQYLGQGDAPRDSKLDVSEAAAYATIGSLILNLDATVTKD